MGRFFKLPREVVHLSGCPVRAREVQTRGILASGDTWGGTGEESVVSWLRNRARSARTARAPLSGGVYFLSVQCKRSSKMRWFATARVAAIPQKSQSNPTRGLCSLPRRPPGRGGTPNLRPGPGGVVVPPREATQQITKKYHLVR